MSSPHHRARENLTEIVSLLVTGIWLAALVTGQWWWLAFMLFGYVVIVPLVALLFGDRETIEEWWEADEVNLPEDSSAEDPLETLRSRYARGELTEAEFERNVEQLLETERIDDDREVAEDRIEQELERR